MSDAPIKSGDGKEWLMDMLGNRFQLLYFVDDVSQIDKKQVRQISELQDADISIEPLLVTRQLDAVGNIPTIEDCEGLVAKRCDAKPGTAYLIRPDQHVTARWRLLDVSLVKQALDRATANS